MLRGTAKQVHAPLELAPDSNFDHASDLPRAAVIIS